MSENGYLKNAKRLQQANARPLNRLCRQVQAKLKLESNPNQVAVLDLALEGDEEAAYKFELRSGLVNSQEVLEAAGLVDPVALSKLVEKQVSLAQLRKLDPKEAPEFLRSVLVEILLPEYQG